MIAQHTWEWIVTQSPHTNKPKTQTRRLTKPSDALLLVAQKNAYCVVNTETGRVRYEVGKDYALQPGRGKKAVCRIRILQISHEDVRCISEADAHREGFSTPLDFLKTWTFMHDPARQFAFDNRINAYLYYGGRSQGWQTGDAQHIYDMLKQRPIERYKAWVIDFELVKEQQS